MARVRQGSPFSTLRTNANAAGCSTAADAASDDTTKPVSPHNRTHILEDI